MRMFFVTLTLSLASAACGEGGRSIPDGGAIACGEKICDARDEYCEVRTSPGTEARRGCATLPEDCAAGDEASCDCVRDEPCGSSCSLDNGKITLTCDE